MHEKFDRIGQAIAACLALLGGTAALITGKGGIVAGYTQGTNIRIGGALGIFIGFCLLYDLVKKKRK